MTRLNKATEIVAEAARNLLMLNRTNNPDGAELYPVEVCVDRRGRRVTVVFGEVVDSTAATVDKTVDINDLFDMHDNGD